MISLNNSRYLLLVYITCALIVVGGIFNFAMYHFVMKERGPKVDCAAFFAIQTEIQTDGVITLHMDGEGHGRINLSATTQDSDMQKPLKLLRDVDFDYRYEGDGYLTIQHLAVTRNASDNMPQELFNRAIFDTSGETRRLRVTKLEDGYIVWNAFSPTLMCINVE